MHDFNPFEDRRCSIFIKITDGSFFCNGDYVLSSGSKLTECKPELSEKCLYCPLRVNEVETY